jgi:hypothetical protein
MSLRFQDQSKFCGLRQLDLVDDVVAAINALALTLTGERDYFSLRAHSIGGSRPE